MYERLRAVEAAAVRGWPALVTMAVDGWLCRATSGGSVRANTVAALAFTGADLEAAIAKVEQFYAGQNASAAFTINEASAPASLDAALAARGYKCSGDHVTMGKTISAAPSLPDTATVSDRPDPAWLAVYLSGLSADRRAIAPRILEGLPPGRFVSVWREGRVVSSGLTILDKDLASVQCMATLPEMRRCGAAGDVLGAIEQQAAVAGAAYLYLQTDDANAPAQALYRRHGFELIGRYHTRIK